MREHPKLFKGNMVRAILDGSKTQTRLPVTFHNSITGVGLPKKAWHNLRFKEAWIDGEYLHVPFEDVVCRVYPRYEVGDHLWLRETFRPTERGIEDPPGYEDGIEYRADMVFIAKADSTLKDDFTYRWRPSIHMPRWASRINLEVTRRWPERVKEISYRDAKAEGLKILQGGIISEFAVLWDSIYGKGAWLQNGYVWVYQFKVIT